MNIRGGFHSAKDMKVYGDGHSIQTIPIKSEAQLFQPNGWAGWFDIVLLDRVTPRNYDAKLAKKERWENDTFWYQPGRAAIEIKYLQLGESVSAQVSKTCDDLKKLERYLGTRRPRSFLGIVALFVQSRMLADWARKRLTNDIDELPASLIRATKPRPLRGVYLYLVSPCQLDKFRYTGVCI